jgi:hypothetical protein
MCCVMKPTERPPHVPAFNETIGKSFYIADNLVSQTSEIMLEVIDGERVGEVYEVEELGMKNTLRTSNDGTVYAGRSLFD